MLDDYYYMLIIVVFFFGYLLCGMEIFDVIKYLDYVNIMFYDLYGVWNDYVGYNVVLYDIGKDFELM